MSADLGATWNTHLVLKAADQAFFGDKQVYTNIPLSASQEGAGNKGQDKKQQKKGGQDELGAAIKNAQNIVDKALAGEQIPAGSNDSKVHSEIAALKKENQDIKKEVAELRKLVQELTLKSGQRLCFADSRRILILGDGNLSFSVALARMFPEKPITSTVLESESAFIRRYHEGEENIRHLRRTDNVELLFSTDATALPADWQGVYDTIIMNFPHPGGKTNLKRSRQLARGIFRSLSTIMTDQAQFHLSLAVGQSGIPYETPVWIPRPPEHRLDSWQVLSIAAEEGFLLLEVLPMIPAIFPGYKSSGYKSTTKGFNNYTAAQRLVFVKYQPEEDFDILRVQEAPKKFHSLRPFFVRDISFLFSCSIEVEETRLLKMLDQLAGAMIVRVVEIPELRSVCPEPLLPNRIYRIYWQTSSVPLTRSLCNRLDGILRKRVVQHISAFNLPLILT